MIILYPILIFLSKTVNGKFSLLQMFPPPKFSSPSLVLHNLRFLTPNFFSPAFFSHPTSSFPKISPDFSSSKSFSSPKVPPSEKALSPQIPFPKTFFAHNPLPFCQQSFFPSFFLPGLSRSSVFSFSTNKKPPVFTDGFFAFSFFANEAYSAGCCSTAGVSLSALSTCSAAASRKARISLSFCAATRFRLRSTVPVPAGIKRPDPPRPEHRLRQSSSRFPPQRRHGQPARRRGTWYRSERGSQPCAASAKRSLQYACR